MANKNIDQIYIANPITSNASTDLMYFGQSPYTAGDDAAMTYANFAAQFTAHGAAVLLAPSGAQTITGFGLTAPTLTAATTITATAGAIQSLAANVIAGSSGNAGNIVSYPAGSSDGTLSLTAANSAGNYANVITNLSTSAARTWSFPDASGTVALTNSPSSGYVLLNPGATQTITTGKLVINNGELDLGNSAGGQGNLLLWTPTTSKGNLQIVAQNNTNNPTIVIQNAVFATSGSSTVNLTIPDPGSLAATFAYAPSTINQLMYSSSANVASGLATANNGLLVTSSGGVPSIGNTIGAAISVLGNITAGASGTAGTLISYPATSSKGSLIVAGVANTGNTNTTISNAAMGQASVISIPDPGASTANFLLNTSSGTANDLAYYAANGSVLSSLATANNGLLVTSGAGVPSIGNAILADITVNGVKVGRGPGNVSTNTVLGAGALALNSTSTSCVAVGDMALGSLVSGNDCTAVGYNALGSATGQNNTGYGILAGSTVTSGQYNTLIGESTGNSYLGGTNLTTGSSNVLIGRIAQVNAANATGCIAIGQGSIALASTGSTSGTNGPGIAIGSSGTPVGFRGDGSIYPSTTGAGFWRASINGTAYMLPLITDGASAWPAITTSSVTFTSTSGIIGTTTNDNAAAGSVGEFITSVVTESSPSSLPSSATATNITSISLTAGDWDVWGSVGFIPASTTVVNNAIGWTGTTSATLPALETASINSYPGGIFIGAGNPFGFTVPTQRYSVSTTTTVYLEGSSYFTTSTMQIYGVISARRVR